MDSVNFGGVHYVRGAHFEAAANEAATPEVFLTRLHQSWLKFSQSCNAFNKFNGDDSRLIISRFPAMLVFQVATVNPTRDPEVIEGTLLRLPITYNHKQNTYDAELDWINPQTGQREQHDRNSYQPIHEGIFGLRLLCVAAIRTAITYGPQDVAEMGPVERRLMGEMERIDKGLAAYFAPRLEKP